jgi:hypothetical protein
LRPGRQQASAGKREGETNGHQHLVHAHRSFPNAVLCGRHAPLVCCAGISPFIAAQFNPPGVAVCLPGAEVVRSSARL